MEFYQLKTVWYNTLTKSYDTDISGASIWGIVKDKYGQQIQNTATRYFLGVHKNAPIHILQVDMGLIM